MNGFIHTLYRYIGELQRPKWSLTQTPIWILDYLTIWRPVMSHEPHAKMIWLFGCSAINIISIVHNVTQSDSDGGLYVKPDQRLDAEDFYIHTGVRNIAMLFQETFSKGHDNKTRGVKKEVLDELSMDESAHYQQKISKYIKRSLLCVSDPMFWFLMRSSHTVRGPWLHFYRFLCIKANSGRLHVVELVSVAIGNVQSSFNQLLATLPHWVERAWKFASQTEDRMPNDLNTQETNQNQKLFRLMSGIAAALLLQNAATFSRRVVRPYSRREI